MTTVWTALHAKLKSRLQQRYFEDSHDGDVNGADVTAEDRNSCTGSASSDRSVDTSRRHDNNHVGDVNAGSPEVEHAESGNLDLLARAVNISILREEQVGSRRQQEWEEMEITRHFIGDRAVTAGAGHGVGLHRQLRDGHVLEHGTPTSTASSAASNHVTYTCTSGHIIRHGSSTVTSPGMEPQRIGYDNASDVISSASGGYSVHTGSHAPIMSYGASSLGTYLCSSGHQDVAAVTGADAAAAASGSLVLRERVQSESEDDLDRRARVLLEHYQKGFHAARESVVHGRGLEGVFAVDQGLPNMDGYKNPGSLHQNIRVEAPEKSNRSDFDSVQSSNSNSSSSNSSNDKFVNGDNQYLQTDRGIDTNSKFPDTHSHYLGCNGIRSIQELIIKQEQFNHQAFEFHDNSYNIKVSNNTHTVPRTLHPLDSYRDVQQTSTTSHQQHAQPPSSTTSHQQQAQPPSSTTSHQQRAQPPSSTPKIHTSYSRISNIILEELQKDAQIPQVTGTHHSRNVSYTTSPRPPTKAVMLMQDHIADPTHTTQTFQSTFYTPHVATTADPQRARHSPTDEELQGYVAADMQLSSLKSLSESNSSPVNFVSSYSLAHAHTAKPSTPSHLRYPHDNLVSSHDRPMPHEMPTDLSLHSRKRSLDSTICEPHSHAVCGYSVSGNTSFDNPTRIPQGQFFDLPLRTSQGHVTDLPLRTSQGHVILQTSNHPNGCITSLRPFTSTTNSHTCPQTLTPTVSKSKGEFAATKPAHINHRQDDHQDKFRVNPPRGREGRPRTDHSSKHVPDIKLLNDKRRMAALAMWTEARSKEFDLQRDYT